MRAGGDDFSRPDMKPKWNVGKGSWSVKDGVVSAVLSLDGNPVGYLKSEGIDHPTKNMLGITVGGKTGNVRNVRFWDATASPDWVSGRTSVLKSLRK